MTAWPFGPALKYGVFLGQLGTLDREIGPAPDVFIDDDTEPLRFKEISRVVHGRRLVVAMPHMAIGDPVFPSVIPSVCELLELDPGLFAVE